MTLDRVVGDMYASMSFEAGRRPDWKLQAEIFADHARLVRVNDDGVFEFDPRTFRENYEAMIDSGELRSFRETELWRQTHEFGDIAHVLSGYEMHTSQGGQFIARAVKSIQLFKKNGTWRISAMIWRREGRNLTLPGTAPGA